MPLKLAAVLIATIFGLAFDASAYSYCSAPSAPNNYSKPSLPTEPSTPYCVNKYARTHTCSDWEISNYEREIDQYNDDLQDYQSDVETYINKLVAYAEDAEEYALCEIKSLD